MFDLFRCVPSSMLPVRSVERSNVENDLHNLVTLIQIRHENEER